MQNEQNNEENIRLKGRLSNFDRETYEAGLAAEGAYNKREHSLAREQLKNLGWERIEFGYDIADKVNPQKDEDTKKELPSKYDFKEEKKEKKKKKKKKKKNESIKEKQEFDDQTDVNYGYLINSSNGFAATVFKNEAKKELIIAYRGTNERFRDLRDWEENILMGCGIAPRQLQDAINLYSDMKKEYPDYKITLSGHSLGGALAMAVGAMSGEDTYTFNAAGISTIIDSINEKTETKIDKDGIYENIKNYRSDNDPLYFISNSPILNDLGETYVIHEDDIERGLNILALDDPFSDVIASHENHSLLRNGRGILRVSFWRRLCEAIGKKDFHKLMRNVSKRKKEEFKKLNKAKDTPLVHFGKKSFRENTHSVETDFQDISEFLLANSEGFIMYSNGKAYIEKKEVVFERLAKRLMKDLIQTIKNRSNLKYGNEEYIHELI